MTPRATPWTIALASVTFLLPATSGCGAKDEAGASDGTGDFGRGGADSSGGTVATRAMHPAGTTITVTSEDGAVFEIEQGAPGEPATLGCADGQREGLLDVGRFPAVAGCAADWIGAQSMRSPRTGRACGDDLAPCVVPADACAPGWHVCGADGRLAEVLALGAEACRQAGGARYGTALSHCETQEGCVYDARASGGDGDGRYDCFESGWCSEAICCGRGCGELGACTDGLWRGATYITRGADQGCGAMTSHRAGAVLCCKDG
jgi:hypothetical protein